MRIEIAIGLLLLISLFNLLNPILFNKSNSAVENQIELPPLPEDLTRQVLDKTVYKIKRDFNRSAWLELYDVFGEHAKAQISLEEVASQFKKLKPAIGNIGGYTYSHYIYEGNSKNADWFEIHYKCSFERGKGTIIISTRTVENKSQVIGLNIRLDEL